MSNKNTKAPNLQMVEIDHNKFAVELLNGNVNVNMTQMAKKYGKRVAHWLELEESKTYVDLLAMSVKTVTADLLEVRQGGIPGNQGTWAKDRRIALRFAQWLDPVFAIHVDTLLLKLLTKQSVVVDPINGVWPMMHEGKPWYNYLDILQSYNFSRRSGQVNQRRQRFPQHFIKLYNQSFVTPEFCGYIKTRQQIIQLSFNFVAANGLPEGGQL